MKSPRRWLLALALPLLLAAAPRARAQDLTPAVVFKPIPDFTVAAGTASSTVKLKKTFALRGVPIAGPFVRFSTVLGNVDVLLRPDVAPQTVANFLNYVNRAAYDGSFIHRSVAGFVVQGGGFRFVNDEVDTIPTDPPVVNEFNLSNVRGTIAMAKLSSGPNTATSQWFFNESDNNAANLDNQNGGFTVFGSVLANGLTVVDAIAALPTYDGTRVYGPAFDSLPLQNFTGQNGLPTANNFATIYSLRLVPLIIKIPGTPALLKLSVPGNSNPGLVTATISGQNLLLSYSPDVTGAATLTVQAKNSAKSKARATFTVTVQ